MKRAASLWAAAVMAGGMAGAIVSPVWAGETVCVGDCNGDGSVAINELITSVNIALGSSPLSACPSIDADGDGNVGINELITAVNNALGGCAGATPTPGVGTPRVFEVAPGELLGTADTTGTGLFTTGLGDANAANSFSPGPLKLLLGTPDASGIAPLTLSEDVYIDISIVDGSRLCFAMKAELSEGSIDCDGGTPYDTLSFQPSGDVGFPFTVTTDLGAPAGPGNGNLLVQVDYLIIAAGTTTPCEDIVYTNPRQLFPFTTTNATSQKGDGGAALIVTVGGEPFDCADFGTPGSGGRLAAGAPATQAPVGDVANVFRFAEQPTP